MGATKKRRIKAAISLIAGAATLVIIYFITGGRIVELRPTFLLAPAIMIIGGFVALILPSMPYEQRYDERELEKKRRKKR